MKVLLLQLDGKLPNLALMRVAAHYAARGDQVELRKIGNAAELERGLWDKPDQVYASLIFERTRPLGVRLQEVYPGVVIGGTGWDLTTTLEGRGIDIQTPDYSVYPDFLSSIGFTQRGCRLRCPFCVVPQKEGKIREEHSIDRIWRGDGHPRELVLLDNDFFGQPRWRDRVAEIRDGGFKVNFNQGINARFLNQETAQAIASVDYRDASMKVRRIYTAWDNLRDEGRLLAGLECLVEAGVKPDHIMVYMLIGYWARESHEDREHRRVKLREFGARPYPMPFERTRELVAFQRWVVGAYDKRIAWEDWWGHAGGEPRRLGPVGSDQLALFGGST